MKNMKNISILNNKVISYIGLLFVVFVWGFAPHLTLKLYEYYSPTMWVLFSGVIMLISYLIMSVKHLKEFNWEYIKIGIPTGFFLALANISQKIGLMYTTPARYAFLENLSCITVPVLMYFLVKKKISFTTVLSCFLCLASVFVLNRISFEDTSSWGMGEILCAASGLLYGFNIAGTGAFAKKLYAPLYLAVQSVVSIITSFIFALILNFYTYTSTSGTQIPLEKIVFSFKFEHIIYAVIVSVVGIALCWIIRTNSMKHIEASAVAVITPFSAVITGILSVILGTDILDLNLALGGLLGMVAIFLSSFDDIFQKNENYAKSSKKHINHTNNC